MTLDKIMDSISPLWGICPFETIKDNLIECRAKSRLPENPESVIVACFPYLLDESEYHDRNVSKYAVVTDYHEVAVARLEKAADMLRKIYPENIFSVFADNSPIPEVRAACYAGLGARGMNSLLITKKYGSYVFLGEIVTDLKINANPTEFKTCIGCRQCICACPSKAISESGFNEKNCLSAITQKKGELSDEEKKLMKECGCVWGCDICQDVCPMNKNAAKTEIKEFLSSAVSQVLSDCDLPHRAYEWRGRKVIERNINICSE
ncbi:MAG: epoxyqueuosine reductase [Clostridia bacterium]|nr:epoxyqueuosine reductase [Clostridia bacterium]